MLDALANHYQKKAANIVRIDDLPLTGLSAWKSRALNRKRKREIHNRILEGIIINHLFS